MAAPPVLIAAASSHRQEGQNTPRAPPPQWSAARVAFDPNDHGGWRIVPQIAATQGIEMPDMTEPEAGYRPDLVSAAADRLVLLSGCSGGGKSSLLAELGRRGWPIYEEPGRQIVKEQVFIGGDALPWDNVEKFVELTISRSIHNLAMAARAGRVAFFDRGIIDQISGLEQLSRPVPAPLEAAAERFRCHETVFMLPPWPEIFRTDAERRHGFEEAAAGSAALLRTYARFGYRLVEVPKLEIGARADFILDGLAAQSGKCRGKR
jgi:predicted ATPase